MQAELEALDPALLTAVMRRALGTGAAAARIATRRIEPMAAIGASGPQVFRAAGDATVGGTTVPWSVVVKRQAPPRDPVRAATDEWRRGPLAHEAGLLPLPGPTAGLSAARIYEVTYHPDGSVWLWTEDLAGLPTGRWEASDYLRAARHFGRFNATPLARGHIPSYPWFFRGFLRYWTDNLLCRWKLSTITRDAWSHPLAFCSVLEDVITGLLQDPETWNHPLLRAAYPEPVAARALRLWLDRHLLLEALERLPVTIIHGDAHGGNLFRRPRPDGDCDTIAIDWDTIGLGPFGEDPGRILGSAALQLGPEPAAAAQLFESFVRAYLAGIEDALAEPPNATLPTPAALRQALPPPDPVTVRFAIAATAALSTGLNAAAVPAAALSPQLYDTPFRTGLERLIGRTVEQEIPTAARAAYFLLDLADESFSLLPHLPTPPSDRGPAQSLTDSQARTRPGT